MIRSSIKYSFVAAAIATVFASCEKEPTPTAPAATGFRAPLDYAVLTDSTAFKKLFIDANGDTTVDLTAGNNRYSMFKALDTYAKLPNTTTTVLEATTLTNMFANTGSPFTGTSAYLNTTTEQLRSKTATTVSNAEVVRTRVESYFSNLATASQSVNEIAAEGKAGKLGTYLVDANGIEWAQIIQKALIGAYQVDYIGNSLLSDASLTAADNTKLVEGKKYTQLEHVWDEAYASLTLKSVYLGAATATTNGGESLLGTYVWEYNKEDNKKVFPAFLKGRAAIVNNDIAVAKAQATIIRTAFEKAIANAAVGYLKKVKDGGTNYAAIAHAYGEGAGFIYSLRFCKLIGGDDAFSEELLADVNFATTGIWKLTPTQLEAAISKIKTRFGLV